MLVAAPRYLSQKHGEASQFICLMKEEEEKKGGIKKKKKVL